MAEADVYRRLQRHLDRMPVPFPATRSGVELRVLQRLFTPLEARIVLALGMIPESVPVVHRRLKHEIEPAALADLLAGMAGRGLVQQQPAREGPRYGKMVFVIGFYEAQVNRLTPEFERDVLQYFDEAFGAALHTRGTQQMRTVPVNRTIPLPERRVGHYDDIGEMVRTARGPFAVMNCICRQGKALVGDPCRRTDQQEHCLMFGSAAQSMVERGIARFVTREEMLALLDSADREGLVLQPQNTRDPLFVCCCCGCCCGVLTTAKKLPKPAEFFSTNYYAEVDAALCQACNTCATRCQMDAIASEDTSARVIRDRCIGCGLCVSTCPSDAIHLRARPDGELRRPPRDTPRLYMQMYRERYGTLGLAAAVARKILRLPT